MTVAKRSKADGVAPDDPSLPSSATAERDSGKHQPAGATLLPAVLVLGLGRAGVPLLLPTRPVSSKTAAGFRGLGEPRRRGKVPAKEEGGRESLSRPPAPVRPG